MIYDNMQKFENAVSTAWESGRKLKEVLRKHRLNVKAASDLGHTLTDQQKADFIAAIEPYMTTTNTVTEIWDSVEVIVDPEPEE